MVTLTEHEQWMTLALEQARKGLGLTSPNPAVGAVIVKDGLLLGAGWHKMAGGPHAEREALADALLRHSADSLRGSTIYVTLEPCSTCGRTPACTDGIIDFGIIRVVYGSVDPNPNHSGAADAILTNHGIEVISGVCEPECDEVLQSFRKRVTTGLPWVIAKSAMSLDGRITRPIHEGQWLTSPASRELVHQLRGEVDAIVIGGRTARKDNPRLTLRSNTTHPDKQQPWRVLLTHSGRAAMPDDLHLFTDEYHQRTLLYEDTSHEQVLKDLADRGCNLVLLECGGRLMRSFVEADLIDEYCLFYAPLITGGEDFGFGAGEHYSQSSRLKRIRVKQIGDDVMIRGIVSR